MTQILSADLGGTKTLLQISRIENDRPLERRSHAYTSAEFDSFEQMLDDFVSGQAIDSACFAVAGPVNVVSGNHQQASITNLPWQLDSQALARRFAVNQLCIINDFQAIGFGIDQLDNESIVTLQQGKLEQGGARAIIGAGTGLGQAYMQQCNGQYQVYATEGGHCDFAPNDELQLELYRYLQTCFGHVSYERLLSGSGLVNIYNFLCEYYPQRRDSQMENKMKQQDPAAVISSAGLQNPQNLAGEALLLFVKIYAAQAGNMVLNYRCNGGLFIAGGIAGKILPMMQTPLFLEAFNEKGRMASLTRATPVYLINNPRVGLLGAEFIALRQHS